MLHCTRVKNAWVCRWCLRWAPSLASNRALLQKCSGVCALTPSEKRGKNSTPVYLCWPSFFVCLLSSQLYFTGSCVCFPSLLLLSAGSRNGCFINMYRNQKRDVLGVMKGKWKPGQAGEGFLAINLIMLRGRKNIYQCIFYTGLHFVFQGVEWHFSGADGWAPLFIAACMWCSVLHHGIIDLYTVIGGGGGGDQVLIRGWAQ